MARAEPKTIVCEARRRVRAGTSVAVRSPPREDIHDAGRGVKTTHETSKS